jgi:hypothetical protein
MTDKTTLTDAQAYEAAYRFVWQYYEREPQSEALMLMLVAMEPTTDAVNAHDPASWEDWQRCVRDTLGGPPIPRFSSDLD